MIKKFSEFVNESTKDLKKHIGSIAANELIDNSKDRSDKVENWHNSAFGDKHRLEFDLPAQVPDAVKNHVESNGGKIDETGHKVTLKSGREVPTSKFLGKSNAPKDVNNEYQHHLKNASAAGDTKLVISKHPGEVASCSTGTHWNSCANLTSDGPGAHFMPSEIQHGTMIAMHVHKDAKPNEDGEYDAKHILGRRLIKRHDTDNDNVTFHQEEKSYGQFPKSAIDKTDEFLEKHNTKNYVISSKNPNVYDDDSKIHKVNPKLSSDEISHLVKTAPYETKKNLVRSDRLSSEDIHHALKDDDKMIRINAMKNPNLTPEHINKGLSDPELSVRTVAALHPNASKENLDTALASGDESVRYSAAKNPKLTKSHIDSIIEKENNPNIVHEAIKNPNASSKHIQHGLDSDNPEFNRAAASNINISDKQLHQALDSKHPVVRGYAADNPAMKEEHFHKVLNDPADHVRALAIHNKHIPKHVLLKFTKHDDEDTASEAKYRYRKDFK